MARARLTSAATIHAGDKINEQASSDRSTKFSRIVKGMHQNTETILSSISPQILVQIENEGAQNEAFDLIFGCVI